MRNSGPDFWAASASDAAVAPRRASREIDVMRRLSFRRYFVWFLAIMLVVALPCGAAHADAATKDAVLKELPATAAANAGAAGPGDPAIRNLTHLLEKDAGLLSQRISVILASLPTLPAELALLGARISQSGPGGRTISRWLLLTLISLVVMIATMVGLPHQLARPRRNLLRNAPQRADPTQLTGIFLLDLAVALAVLLLGYAAIEAFFADHQLQSRVAAGLISAVAVWRLALLPVDLLLRPGEPMARLLPLDDAAAAAGRRFCSVLLLVVAIQVEGIGTHYGTGLAIPQSQLVGFFCGPIVATMLIVGIRRARVGVAAAIASGGTAAHIRLAPLWHWLAIAIVLLLLVAWLLGTLALNLIVFQTLMGSLLVLALALALDRYLSYLSDRLFQPAAAGGTGPVPSSGAMLFRRCVRVALWSLVAIVLIEVWAIDLGRLIEPEQWKRLAGAILTAGITLYVAFVVWQLISFHIDRAIRNSPATTAFDPADPNPGKLPKVGTRLRTMLPLLRIVLLVAVGVLAVLVVLSELGVNTAPLIAGASVFGLAISFGSQALVKDVVSGIFYMADDAFRVGEYIDTGKLKGTVEGMTVRSLKLRHQNGPLHTIPFGELASVTNYSRHFATMKFNIRLVRDVDLELVRKTVKRVGLEMMEDLELQPEMICRSSFRGSSTSTRPRWSAA